MPALTDFTLVEPVIFWFCMFVAAINIAYRIGKIRGAAKYNEKLKEYFEEKRKRKE